MLPEFNAMVVICAIIHLETSSIEMNSPDLTTVSYSFTIDDMEITQRSNCPGMLKIYFCFCIHLLYTIFMFSTQFIVFVF